MIQHIYTLITIHYLNKNIFDYCSLSKYYISIRKQVNVSKITLYNVETITLVTLLDDKLPSIYRNRSHILNNGTHLTLVQMLQKLVIMKSNCNDFFCS